jgi:hypothetical protein
LPVKQSTWLNWLQIWFLLQASHSAQSHLLEGKICLFEAYNN